MNNLRKFIKKPFFVLIYAINFDNLIGLENKKISKMMK